MTLELSSELLISAYASGVFPMADDDDEIMWFAPNPRAIIPLDEFKVSRSLRSTCRRNLYTTTVNRAFREVIGACADRPEGTWISDDILKSYCELHDLGFAHSIEAWHGETLAGGLYGVSLGGAFFGESMFHSMTDASKVALVALVERMRSREYELLDIQFMTDHLRRFGAIEIPREEYENRLAKAIVKPVSFVDLAPSAPQQR